MRKTARAIVPSAGLGKRFDPSSRKPFFEITGIPVLIHTLKKLHDAESIAEIILVLREQDVNRGRKLIETHNLHKVKRIVPGGKERQDSVYNALLHVHGYDGLVLIHDGVRPLISAQLIERLLNEIEGVDGVVPGLPVKETLKKIDADGMVLSTPKRDMLWSIQTPQVFTFHIIKEAFDKAHTDGFYATDDAALVERIGGKVKIIAGSPFNIKITTPEDFEIVKSLNKL
jgi:2-C-methyl-D-erythritol 4-phosphate cytidylyltransferase